MISSEKIHIEIGKNLSENDKLIIAKILKDRSNDATVRIDRLNAIQKMIDDAIAQKVAENESK